MYFSIALISLFAASTFALPATNESCADGMQFHPCGKACPATCDDPDPVCTKQCQPGCRCVEPLVQNEIGVCVLRSTCPNNGDGDE